MPFESLLADAVDLAYSLWSESSEYTWHGRTVYGIGRSKSNLPATEQLREAFNPEGGLEHPGKGHYLLCQMSTVYDVYRQLPVARKIISIAEGNEHEEAKSMLANLLHLVYLLLFDRGYPIDKLINGLLEHD